MHRKNKEHLQGNLFYDFPPTMSEFIDIVKETKEYSFYENIFCEIDESIFEPLYCKNNGRPNAPTNTMVCALSLKEEHEWSYSEMFSEIKYNLAVRTALGLFSFYGMPFSESTIFQFQNLIYNYELKTGINLFEKAFDDLVRKHIKKYKIKTDIVRLDSFMIDSNIRKYVRLQFLIEIIKRLYRALETRDKKKFKMIFKPYNHVTSEHYIYELKSGKVSSELKKIANIYYLLKTNLSSSIYESKQAYKNFIRVFDEHFSVEDKKIRVKAQSEIGSDTLQSPDDTDATYRKKRKVSYRGQSGNVVETGDKENDVNIILDLCVFPNNVDDSAILNERLDIIKEKTEDLKKAHFDGGFGSEDNDKKMKELGINPVQTAIKGRKAEVVIDIKKDEESEEFEVSCPNGQTVKAERTPKRFKACFNKEICKSCPFSDKCPATVRKNYRVYYFSSEDFLKRKRHANLRHIPPDRRNLRANVEATVREFTRHMQGHKLKVRGTFKAELYLFSVGIMINFGRIYRYLKKKGGNGGFSFIFNFKRLIFCQILLKIKQNLLKIDSLFQIQTT